MSIDGKVKTPKTAEAIVTDVMISLKFNVKERLKRNIEKGEGEKTVMSMEDLSEG